MPELLCKHGVGRLKALRAVHQATVKDMPFGELFRRIVKLSVKLGLTIWFSINLFCGHSVHSVGVRGDIVASEGLGTVEQ